MSGREETEIEFKKYFQPSPAHTKTHMVVIQGADRGHRPAGGVIADNILLILVDTFQSELCTNILYIPASRAHNQRENKSQH